MSCDEQVLKELGEGERKSYSLALLHAAEQRCGLLLPPAFGESHTRSRIKNVLNYRKPGFWITALAIVIVAAAGAGLMTNPVVQKAVEETGEQFVLNIGGADGPTSIFIAGKADDGKPLVFDQMPDTAWLSETSFPATFPGEEAEGKLSLDYASEDLVMFHGDFGLFVFEREGRQWNLKYHTAETDFPGMDEMIKQMVGNMAWKSKDSIHREDRLVSSGYSTSQGNAIPNSGWRDAAAGKMLDGSIAVLGGYTSGDTIRLVDLFYGYYHPDEQIFHQVYLFGGDREMIINPEGEISEQRYLFSRDEYDYYLRTPEKLLKFEKREGMAQYAYHFPYGRLELVRYQGQEETVLDDMMCMQGGLEQQKVVVAGDRIVYTGAAGADMLSFKNPGLISIAMDGSDRRAADIPYDVYDGLSYEGGYLYYQGWTNEGTMPRPLYRITPDFETQEFLADLDGSLITVKEGGGAYVYNWDTERVEVCGVESKGNMRSFDRPGEDARHHSVETERIGDVMTVTLKTLDGGTTERYYIGVGS